MRFFTALLFLCAAAKLTAETTLRLHGSTTVKAALEARQDELEAKAHAKLEMRALGSGSGLLALTTGAADLAMISSPLEDALRSAEKKSGPINAAELKATSIGTMRLTFIVNPRNPVRRLSAAQLADIFSGRVTNWREIGGSDWPITVVNLANAGSLVEDKLLNGAKITAKAKEVPTAAQIPPVVAQELGAIGIISTAHARGKTSVITTDADITAPLFLVTKGQPEPVAAKLIEAARALLGENHGS